MAVSSSQCFSGFGPLTAPVDPGELNAWKARLRTTRGLRCIQVLREAARFIGTPEAVTPVGRILRAQDTSRDETERVAAVRALGILADPLGLLAAVGLLDHPDASLELRVAAVEALGRGGIPAIVPLTKLFGVDQPDPLRLAAARSLLGMQAHAQAAQVVADLVPADLTDLGLRRLHTMAALAAGDTATVALRGLDGLGWPEVSRWAIASHRAQQELTEDDLVMRLVDSDDATVALDAPVLAASAPAQVLALLDNVDWRPGHPQAGRWLFVAGLLGATAAGVLKTWALQPDAPMRVQLIAGLAAADLPPDPKAPAAWRWGRAIDRPNGWMELLADTKADPDNRRLPSYLIHHRMRWPGEAAGADPHFIKTMECLPVASRGAWMWLTGELAIPGSEAALTECFPQLPYAAWALGEVGTTQALQLLRHLPIPTSKDQAEARKTVKGGAKSGQRAEQNKATGAA